ncbi:beta-glucosidase, partial [Kouleothrix aurantiaca]
MIENEAFLTAEQRIESLLDAMTLEEQVALLAGADFWTTVPIERLGIPAIKVSDGPNGARGGGSLVGGVKAASFPVGIALAASWDPALVKRVGQALAEEALSKGARVLLAPTVNIHRSTLNGRNFECYSEDPHLSARLAVAYIQGLQQNGVGATVKHFVGNESEFERMTISSEIDERALREIYLPPFEAAVKEAKTWALMSSYNKLNGTYVSERADMLLDLLKGEWGFDGVVMSDWFATHSTAPAQNGGLDLEMPGPSRFRG